MKKEEQIFLKKGTIVLITTEEAPITIEIDGEKQKTFPRGALVFNDKIDKTIKLVKTGEVVNPEMGYKRAHLLLIIEDEAKEGSVILTNHGTEEAQKEYKEALVVVASTNKDLGLPRFSKSFLERYEEKQGINNVFVAYTTVSFLNKETRTIEEKIVPKTNRNGIISLRKAKMVYTIGELKALFRKMKKELCKDIKEDKFNEWVSQNV
jgi:hypothetical protein